MARRRFGLMLALASLPVCQPWFAHVAETAAPSPQRAYTESPDELKRLVFDILVAKQARDDAALNELLKGLVLQDHAAWMAATFGEPVGKRIAATYGERHDHLPAMLSTAFGMLLDEGLTQVEIVTHDEPNVRLPAEGASPAMVLSKLRPTRLYEARFVSRDGQTTKGLWHFAYVDGGFRYVGTLKPAPAAAPNESAPPPAQPTAASATAPSNNASVELLTPNQGVDFTPYLNRVLSSVKRNWYAVIPESARMGEKGRVVLQFRILRGGNVPYPEPNVVVSSNKEPLDRAAISSVLAANPFEPLPAAFSGPQIELRLIFLYNSAPSESGPAPQPSPPSAQRGGEGAAVNENAPVPPKPPMRMRVAGSVQMTKLEKQVPPVYPPLAKQARIMGTVRLQAVITKDGAVGQLEVVSGHPLLVRAALDAVRQWKYRPTLLNGEPVEVLTTMDVVFVLGKKR